MLMSRRLKTSLILVGLAFFGVVSFAQEAKPTGKKKGKEHKLSAVYFSWGYNQEWYTKCNVHVEQPRLNSNYDFIQVDARDHMGWNNKSIFSQALTIPQYNYRLGFYIGKEQKWGVELNFDHTKYLIRDGQNMRMKGTFKGREVDTNFVFSEANGDYYYLNNGANFFLFNIVRRVNLFQDKKKNFVLDFVGKAGIGPVVPHVENRLFGDKNDQLFQFGGWNTGLETVVRATIHKYAFIEFSQKVDYARYSNLKVYQGLAKQNFGTYELIMSIGFVLPTNWHTATEAKK